MELKIIKFRNVVAWAEPDQKQHFSGFRVPFDYPALQPTRNNFTPNQWYRWKAETLKICLLLVWRVCDQAFGWPLKGAEKCHLTKISLNLKMLFFSIYDEK